MASKFQSPYTYIDCTGHSDGNELHRPSDPDGRWNLGNPDLYLVKLAQKYAEESGTAVRGLFPQILSASFDDLSS